MARRHEGNPQPPKQLGNLADEGNFSDSDSSGTIHLKRRLQAHNDGRGRKEGTKPRRRRTWGVPSLLSRQESHSSIDTGFGRAHDLVMRDAAWNPNKELSSIKRTMRPTHVAGDLGIACRNPPGGGSGPGAPRGRGGGFRRAPHLAPESPASSDEDMTWEDFLSSTKQDVAPSRGDDL
ncbi:unnamed protein product, partial [Discosporangium mesarthrocarpum]